MAIDIVGFLNTQEPIASLTVEKKQAFLDDYVAYFGYQETIDGQANPQSKIEFANEKILEDFENKINAVRERIAKENAVYEKFSSK